MLVSSLMSELKLCKYLQIGIWNWLIMLASNGISNLLINVNIHLNLTLILVYVTLLPEKAVRFTVTCALNVQSGHLHTTKMWPGSIKPI